MTNDHDTITLKDAASHFGYTVWTLRAEAGRGRLTIYKIGKKLYTQRRHVEALNREWFAKRNIEPKGSGVYVVGFDNYIKIGWSGDLPSRLNTIRCSLPTETKIHITYECAKENERILHRRFRAHKTRGEWFRNEGALADWIKRKCPL